MSAWPAPSEPRPRGGISAIMIAKDEEADLPGCLESLRGLVSEVVIVVAADSQDRTEAIAREAGATVIMRAFDDYERHRQASLDAATREWCLWIDCDERVTPALRQTLPDILGGGGEELSGCEIPFEVHFLGRRLRFGGLGSESHMRVFRRARARFIGGALHEGVELHGRRSRCAGGTIIHTPYRDVSDYFSKFDAYTTLAARKRFEGGVRWRPWHQLLPFWEFCRRVFLRLGILDGHAGLVWAGLSAYHSWVKYLKLRELERRGGAA